VEVQQLVEEQKDCSSYLGLHIVVEEVEVGVVDHIVAVAEEEVHKLADLEHNCLVELVGIPLTLVELSMTAVVEVVVVGVEVESMSFHKTVENMSEEEGEEVVERIAVDHNLLLQNRQFVACTWEEVEEFHIQCQVA